MLRITLHGVSARWEKGQWACRDQLLARMLNSTVPADIGSVDVPFRTGGQQGYALKAARKAFGQALKVTRKTPPIVPPEEPGVDYAGLERRKQ